MIVINNEYTFGDIVYLKTDEDQAARMVTSIIVDNSNSLIYKVVKGSYESSHYDFEMSKEKNILITTTN